MNILPILLFVTIISVLSSTFAQEKKQNNSTNSNTIILNVRGGMQFGVNANDFFRPMSAILQLPKQPDFSLPLSVSVAAKFRTGMWNVGIDGGYTSTSVSENATVPARILPDTTTVGSRNLSETVSLSLIPVILVAEIVPVESQFKTYMGVGAGVGFAGVKWTEKLSSDVPNDIRVGGTLLNETKVIPVFRIYSGIQFGYDKFAKSSSGSGSVIMEVHYTYAPVKVQAFRKFAEQFPVQPPQAFENVQIGASAVSLHLGFQFTLAATQR
ncbi:MAG: hypothetical protein JNL32_07380 [Candidatus Kapabacteria bacterium]|nr:hypothetical protein [Candidatus Kapabacteria bacterium]